MGFHYNYYYITNELIRMTLNKVFQGHYSQSRKTKRVANVLNVRSLAGSVETRLEQVRLQFVHHKESGSNISRTV